MQTNETTDRYNEESSRFFKFFESTLKTCYVPVPVYSYQNIPVHTRDRINTECSLHRLSQQGSSKE